jgi:AraC family transcriptional regulator
MDLSRREGRVLEIATAVRDVRTIALAERLARACHAHSTDATLLREALALSLLAAVSPDRAAAAVLSSPPGWLAVAREQLDDRCDEAVRIAEIAQACGVHPVHLARVFRRYLGCSPGDYLRRRRLARSSVLLRETDRPLSDIALSSGYSDQSHLAKAFKADTGLTLMTYRQSMRACLRRTPSRASVSISGVGLDDRSPRDLA